MRHIEIENILTISTSHITEETAAVLENMELVVYKKGNCGWFIYVDSANAIMDTIPNDLKECLGFAKSLRCNILCLDSDGPIVENMGVYSWQN